MCRADAPRRSFHFSPIDGTEPYMNSFVIIIIITIVIIIIIIMIIIIMIIIYPSD